MSATLSGAGLILWIAAAGVAAPGGSNRPSPQAALSVRMSASLTNAIPADAPEEGARSSGAIQVAVGAALLAAAGLAGLMFAARKKMTAPQAPGAPGGAGAAPGGRAQAEAFLEAGRPDDAAAVLMAGLARDPGEGADWLFLAEIQAVKLKDLEAASATVLSLAGQSGRSIGLAALALEKLAQWRLERGLPSVEVAWPLAEIIRRFPRSGHAEAARKRILALPGGAPAGLEAELNAPAQDGL